MHPLLVWMHRIVPKFDPKPHDTDELWISRADGTGLHEIGHVPVKYDAVGTREDPLGDIQWLPNGKQISFVYHNVLYVVPAEIE